MARMPLILQGMTEPLERYLLQVTEILNSCYMELLGGHHKLKHVWKCSINLESIKQGINGFSCWGGAESCSCELFASRASEQEVTIMLIYLNCVTLFDVSVLQIHESSGLFLKVKIDALEAIICKTYWAPSYFSFFAPNWTVAGSCIIFTISLKTAKILPFYFSSFLAKED